MVTSVGGSPRQRTAGTLCYYVSQPFDCFEAASGGALFRPRGQRRCSWGRRLWPHAHSRYIHLGVSPQHREFNPFSREHDVRLPLCPFRPRFCLSGRTAPRPKPGVGVALSRAASSQNRKRAPWAQRRERERESGSAVPLGGRLGAKGRQSGAFFRRKGSGGAAQRAPRARSAERPAHCRQSATPPSPLWATVGAPERT